MKTFNTAGMKKLTKEDQDKWADWDWTSPPYAAAAADPGAATSPPPARRVALRGRASSCPDLDSSRARSHL